MKKISYSLIITFVLFTVFKLNAQENHLDVHHNTNHNEVQSEHPSHNKNHVVYQHHLALFTGLTSNLTHEVNLWTIGLDYEYRLAFWGKKLGVGLNAEYLAGDHTEKLFGIPVFYHPTKGLKFDVAPMWAIVEEFSEDTLKSHEEEASESINEFGFRIGAIYDIHFNRFSISPTVNVDNIGHSWAIAFGVSFGLGFHEMH